MVNKWYRKYCRKGCGHKCLFTVSSFHLFYQFINLLIKSWGCYMKDKIKIEARFLISVTVHMTTVGFWLTKFSIHSVPLENQSCSPQCTLPSWIWWDVGATPHGPHPPAPEPWKLVFSPGRGSYSNSLAHPWLQSPGQHNHCLILVLGDCLPLPCRQGKGCSKTSITFLHG